MKFWQAEAEWLNGRPVDAEFSRCATSDEAANDARIELAMLSSDEIKRVKNVIVREYEGDDESAVTTGNSVAVAIGANE